MDVLYFVFCPHCEIELAALLHKVTAVWRVSLAFSYIKQRVSRAAIISWFVQQCVQVSRMAHSLRGMELCCLLQTEVYCVPTQWIFIDASNPDSPLQRHLSSVKSSREIDYYSVCERSMQGSASPAWPSVASTEVIKQWYTEIRPQILGWVLASHEKRLQVCFFTYCLLFFLLVCRRGVKVRAMLSWQLCALMLVPSVTIPILPLVRGCSLFLSSLPRSSLCLVSGSSASSSASCLQVVL